MRRVPACLTILLLIATSAPAEDLPPLGRGDCVRVFFPLPAEPGDVAEGERWFIEAQAAARGGQLQEAFEKLWRAHHANPADVAVRRALSLPPERVAEPTIRSGRGAPPILRWPRRGYLQAETPHFTIFSTADRAATTAVAEQLERYYWVWTQVFFPLWEGRTDVRRGIEGAGGIGSGNERMRVVLFRDFAAYVQALERHVPGIERSTGFYSDEQRCTFLFAGEGADAATWYHELTHQLLRQATRSGLRVSERPGEAAGFWLVEGIATYMESLRFAPRHALVGGWESPRLQFARYRWLAAGDRMQLAELVPDGRLAAQQHEDLARWYAHAAAYTHLLMDGDLAGGKASVLGELIELYQVARLPAETSEATAEIQVAVASERMPAFLTLDDQRLYPPDPQIPLHSICLGHCRVTAEGLARIAPQSQLRWLDLAALPVDVSAVRRLVADAGSLDQLNLEKTEIDNSVAAVLQSAANLTELDLSFTRVGDEGLQSLPAAAPLETVFLTGTQVGNATAASLAQRPTLKQLDVQRTAVTEATVEQLRSRYPDVQFNPLQLISP